MKKKALTIVLTLALCLGLLTVPALAAESVSYVEYSWDGTSLSSATNSVTEYTEVTSGDTTWSGGWYVVNENVTISGGVSVSGDVHLILTDRNSLTINGDVSFESGNSLTVYGQAEGTGALTVTGGMANGSVGHNSNGGNGGTVTVHGGTVNVDGDMAIGGNGSNGGDDKRGAGYDGGSGGSVTVNGGTVAVGGSMASGGSGGSGKYGQKNPIGGSGGSGGSVTVHGGMVAVGGSMASGGSMAGGGNGGDGSSAYSANNSGGCTGGTGGSGGCVIVTDGSVTVTDSVACGGNGGKGGDGKASERTRSASGGSGGNGSTVTVSGGTVTIGGSMASGGSGGCGGYGHYSKSASGGNGGSGSTVTVSGGTVTVTGSMASGGSGGKGGDSNGRNGNDGGDGGNGGNGGTVAVSGGTATVNGSLADGGNRGQRGTSGYSHGSYGSNGSNGTAVGIIYQNNNGTVYGDVTLEHDLEIPVGATLTVPAGASLTVNGTITNNGALSLQTKDSLTVTGSITGGGENRIMSITAEQIIVPADLVYNGTDQTDTVRSRIYLKDTENIFGAIFTCDTASWTLDSISPAEVKVAGNYTVSYKNGENTISTTFFVGKKVITNENTSVVGFASMTYNGQAQTTASDLAVDLGDGRTETITGVTWSAVTNVTDTTTAAVETTNFIGTVSKPAGMAPLDLSTVTIEKANTLTYNGGELTQQITVKEPGGNTVSGYAVSGNTASTVKTDGDYTLTVSAGENINYTGSKTFDWNIDPKPLTVTAVIPEAWWGDAPVIPSAPMDDGLLYNTDTVEITGLTAVPANPADIGDSVPFLVDSTSAVFSGSGHENYAITVAGTATGKVKVIPLIISGITMDAETYTYGDPVGYDTTALTITQPGGTTANSDDLVCTYTGTANDGSTWNDTIAPTKAGSYTLTASHRDTAHYAGSRSLNFTIARKSVEVPVHAAAVTYNGAAQTYAVTETAYYSIDGGIQTAANEAGYDVTISLKDSDNTCWAGGSLDDLMHSFVINKAPATVTAKNLSYHVGTRLPDTSVPELGKHYTVDGLFGEDIIGAVTMKYQKNGEDVTPDQNRPGTYDIIMVVTDVNPNYEVSLVSGKLSYYYSPTYTPTVEQSTGGTVIVSNRYPSQGQTVTVTPKPDDGYKVSSITITDKDGNAVEVKKNDNGTYSYVQPYGAVSIKVSYEPIKAFADVSKDSYYYDAVYWAVGEGVTNGTSEETFSPNAVCTRAQAVTFLWRAAGCPEPESSVMPFTDVAEGSYYYKAVLWAVENGITNGTSATIFSTNARCSRAQIVTFLWRSEHGFEMEGKHGFHDVHEDAYYHDAVLWAVENGITRGTGDTTFNPAAECTRAQIVTFLWRCLAE